MRTEVSNSVALGEDHRVRGIRQSMPSSDYPLQYPLLVRLIFPEIDVIDAVLAQLAYGLRSLFFVWKEIAAGRIGERQKLSAPELGINPLWRDAQSRRQVGHGKSSFDLGPPAALPRGLDAMAKPNASYGAEKHPVDAPW